MKHRHPWHQALVVADIHLRGWLRKMWFVARGGIPFCDFCDCPDCLEGNRHISHAPTACGRWICSTCWRYDVCVTAKGHCGPPCEDQDGSAIPNCPHRPRLVGDWQ